MEMRNIHKVPIEQNMDRDSFDLQNPQLAPITLQDLNEPDESQA